MLIIRQTVTFSVSAEELFDTYLDSRKHSAVTGDKVSITGKVGGKFSAFSGNLSGRNY
ncbi:MAG: hypothetical protein ACT4OO_03465 [Nitrospiraceae bacterium]